jgi:hypothetical protein
MFHSNLQKKSFYTIRPKYHCHIFFLVTGDAAKISWCVSLRVNLLKLIGLNLLNTFCKLNYFTNISYICCITMKRCSLQQRVSKFATKMFYEIDPTLV